MFEAEDEAEFCEVLYDRFDAAGLDTKIMCWDHNKERLFERAQETGVIIGIYQIITKRTGRRIIPEFVVQQFLIII